MLLVDLHLLLRDIIRHKIETYYLNFEKCSYEMIIVSSPIILTDDVNYSFSPEIAMDAVFDEKAGLFYRHKLFTCVTYSILFNYALFYHDHFCEWSLSMYMIVMPI